MTEDKLKRTPQKPGIYLLKSSSDKILYIGKAKRLRSRLRSHFKPGKAEDLKHAQLMKKVTHFEVIVTDSEVEALILEANLIKEHRPRYNIDLKDDKSYPYIRLSNECYPRVFVTRKIIRDGSKYFGPYTDVGNMRQLMAAIRRIFPIRTCRLHITQESIQKKKHKVCLNFHIGKCRGPCEGLIATEDYLWLVNQVMAFIQGQNKQLVEALKHRMEEMSRKQSYEEAALLRDQVQSVTRFHAKQKVVDGVSADRDIVTVVSEGDDACGVVFNVRNGKIINRQHFYFKGVEGVTKENVMTSFVKQFYLRTDEIPGEIFLSSPVEDSDLLKIWLADKGDKKVHLIFPQRGKRAHLIEMCLKNATLLLDELLHQKSQKGDWIAPSVQALQKDLRLPHPPKTIEAFDISNIQGKDAVASMVCFENGKPKKKEYRKFKIKTVQGADDFAMMAEVISRRYSRLLKEKKPLPDLILVDGGKGQLSSAIKVLEDLAIVKQPIIGLAKRLEEVFLPGISEPQTLPKISSSLRLLQRIRDEAHRFAITFHRSLRKKRTIHTVLDDIPGIGEKRRKALLKAFGSLSKLREASIEEVVRVDGMNQKIAEKVVEALRKK